MKVYCGIPCSYTTHVMTSLSCFFDTGIINEIIENSESNDNIMDRILQGKDLKSEIDKFVVVDPDFVTNRYFQTGDYAIWNFARTFLGIRFAQIKNLFVNPDFGKQGLHSKDNSLEPHCNTQLFWMVTRIEIFSRHGTFTSQSIHIRVVLFDLKNPKIFQFSQAYRAKSCLKNEITKGSIFVSD